MGAEQVGFLVKGPRRIRAAQIAAAVRACEGLRKRLLAAAGVGATPAERTALAWDVTGYEFDPLEIAAYPEHSIQAFVSWWHGMDERDACYRIDPDDPRQKLVYVGETSWGDEPQGCGYHMLKRAFAWAFAPALGIR